MVAHDRIDGVVGEHLPGGLEEHVPAGDIICVIGEIAEVYDEGEVFLLGDVIGHQFVPFHLGEPGVLLLAVAVDDEGEGLLAQGREAEIWGAGTVVPQRSAELTPKALGVASSLREGFTGLKSRCWIIVGAQDPNAVMIRLRRLQAGQLELVQLARHRVNNEVLVAAKTCVLLCRGVLHDAPGWLLCLPVDNRRGLGGPGNVRAPEWLDVVGIGSGLGCGRETCQRHHH